MGFWSRLARTGRPRRHAEDIDEEIAFHLAMSRRDGRDPRIARLRFGNPASIREQIREAGILVWLESLTQDLRYALRQLRRAPMFTAVAVVSLAIGIGASTALYALTDAVLLRLLPVRDPVRLVTVKLGNWGDSSSVRAYETLRDGSGDVLAGLAAYATRGLTVSGDGMPERVDGAFVSDNFFSTLGVVPSLGRPLGAMDERDGGVVVVSHGFWQRRLGHDPAVLGRHVQINGRPFHIVGVAPHGFSGLDVGRSVDVYLIRY